MTPPASASRALLALAAVILGACTTMPPSGPTSAPVQTATPTLPSATTTATPSPGPAGSGATQDTTTPPGVSTPVSPAVGATPATPAPPSATEEPAQVVDPLRPEWRPSSERSERLDLWQRIREGYGVPNFEGPLVRSREQSYASNPDYLQRMTERGGRYLFHIVEEVQRRKMPTELALLPFVESAFVPTAVSSARASGIWQFMPATGRHYDLTQNVFRDDRRDVLASTHAALDYLGKLHGMFGDWQLALAAYNWGEGNVKHAIRRNKARGLRTDYASLSMPNETRHYVPKLQAIKNIVTSPENFGIRLMALENHPYFLAVPIRRDIDIDLAARLANLPLDEFKALNPQLERPVILAAGTPQILLPYDNANTFVKALGSHRGPMASWTAWTLPSSMKSAEAAQRVGMSDEGFRTVNHIPPKMVLKGGSTVVVPRGSKHEDVSERVADTASMAMSPETPPQRRVIWRVGRRAESVAAVAKRHHLDASQVATWNQTSAGASFAPGTRVTLYVPVRTRAVASARHGSKPTAGKSSRKASSATRVAHSRSNQARRR